MPVAWYTPSGALIFSQSLPIKKDIVLCPQENPLLLAIGK